MNTLKNKTILLVDGHALAFRAFYALPELTAPDGTPTNAILGFVNMMFKTIDECHPDMTAVIFDAPGKTFRHDVYPEYKMGRRPTPEEYKIQVPILLELLRAMGIKVVVKDGVEADDVIASAACGATRLGVNVVALTSDKDILQVLQPGVRVIRPKKGITIFTEYNEITFEEEWGFAPTAMPDYLALLGDSVDNIPGVPGVGEKTAKKLLSQYKSLEDIYDHIEELKPGLQKKFSTSKELAFKSRELIRLKCDLPLTVEEFVQTDVDFETFENMCRQLGLNKILERVRNSTHHESEEQPQLEIGEAVEGDLEKVLQEKELALYCAAEGSYPMDLNRALIVLRAQNGHFWRGVVEAQHIPDSLSKWLKTGNVITSDYKTTQAFFKEEVPLHDHVWDAQVAHYLLHPDAKSHGPEQWAAEAVSDPVDVAGQLWRVQNELGNAISHYSGLEDLMRQVELPIVPVLWKMETWGIGLEKKTFEGLDTDLEERIADIENTIAEKGGERINLNSPKQVAWLLFEKLQMPPIKETKTGYSTDVTVLEELVKMDLPEKIVPELILEHRELSKMRSGFVHPLMGAVNEKTGLIHGTFESTSTGTGRLSSRDPNLQNLPAFGQWSTRLKEGLVPRHEGNVYVAADYSQVELRVLAHLCDEKRLKSAFEDHRDVHTETASWVFNVEPELVTPELRRFAKVINFGILYGMSSYGLAARLGIGQQEAGDIINKYFKALPKVKDYVEESYKEARQRGYAMTSFGRIRPLNEVSVNPRDRGALKRIAVNTPIQGTAADIARMAMIKFFHHFEGRKNVHLVLQIHDSLVCECAAEEREGIEKELANVMESAAKLSVPLKVETKWGKSLANV
ncbi:MAG: DNA polymerase I [Aminobacterium sp.]|uniref:DNA polymerase I n=1 Tax=Aminobacterium sp. TaxID=1872491 RepID=UPI001BCAF969|nr:DNA polymerase I [Aminobacterium sp.]MDD2206798.1 DNA polymerase I [Aminobacterium sp.]MDD3427138.1 DNA polymerase I [Aminobacterium sp.]MDD3707278.1 DNA polymerase I [Aminobacterium sp.]MDD4228556.1 DNA polymerase I [Aminobacterium sp.]MEA4876635.1 DNA polymerase I [Aminobacterium sp.]